MNILFLCDEYPPCQHGGIGSVTQLLARTLVRKGHNVSVAGFYPYYRKANSKETDQGVSVYRYFYGSQLLLQLSKRSFFGRFFNIEHHFNKYLDSLRTIIKDNKIEIIESPDFSEAFRYSGPKMIQFPNFGIPMIIKLHGSYSVLNIQEKKFGENSNTFFKELTLLNSAAGIVAVSESIKQRVIDIFKFKHRIDVLYNGIVLNDKAKYDIKNQSNTVVFAGTLVRTKGIFSLLEAWRNVLSFIPFAHLDLYGKGDSKTIREIQTYLKDFPKESVILRGFISKEQLPAIYSSASCAIFPSFQESFSMAPMEAMAIGCPVIYTKRTSGPELIINGVDGLLVDPDNIPEIAGAMILLLTNRVIATEIGQMGFQKIKNSFDISIIAEKHIGYYSEVIQDFK
jgi:glycogen synthase